MDDVIFAGTSSRPARDFAEVSILLERQSSGEATRECEITRRIERSAGSAYRIDGRDVRAKDVALLFADAATGAHSPALVSQGKISAIISAKPVERRLLLEEAAGISGLHARRRDAEQKLRAAEANLVRLGEILSDQEQRVGQLRRQARAAERYRKLSNQIRALDARLLHTRWFEAEKASESAMAQAQECALEVERIAQAIASAQRAQDRASEELGGQAPGRRSPSRAGAGLGPSPCERAGAVRYGRSAPHRTRRRSIPVSLPTLSASKRSNPMLLRQSLSSKRSKNRIATRLDDAETQTLRVSAELTSAESQSRDLEAALAALLARQAATARRTACCRGGARSSSSATCAR